MDIINKFKENRNEENSKSMKKYMKDKFEFLGIKSPLRKELQKEFLKGIDKNSTIDKELVKYLWDQEYREFQYLALDYLVKEKKKLQKEGITFIKELITTKSWWDTVDLIDSHLVGQICEKYPELVDEYILRWSQAESMWLRRTAILYQLKYKEKTNKEVLERVIKDNIEDKRFFIQKAIGWSLREYSKVNKEWVRDFISNNNLSSLSIREGSKYLD
ncbi:DNA alkylation repair protein [Clostridium paraputrificum]|uniref:DNA alkylation repair protein n=1 Tax=Clostridium paraputrificum TaxID=29363 RepID=UPI003D32977E